MNWHAANGLTANEGNRLPGNRQLCDKRRRPDAGARLGGNLANPKVATFCAALLAHFYSAMDKMLKMTPAIAAGVYKTLHDTAWIVGLINAATPAPKVRGHYKKKSISN